MDKGYFIVKSEPVNTYEIQISLNNDLTKSDIIPDELVTLFQSIEQTAKIIESIDLTKEPEFLDSIKSKIKRSGANNGNSGNSDESKKKEYIMKLIDIGQVGLVGELAQPKLATTSLELLKNEICLEVGGKIKNRHMRVLGYHAILLGFIALIYIFLLSEAFDLGKLGAVGTFLRKFFEVDFSKLGFNSSSIIRILWAWIGAMIGTWLSFGIRNIELKFENLAVIEKDQMNTFIRLCFMGVIAMVILVFLTSGIITLEIGGFTVDDILTRPDYQCIIGIICGLAESKVSSSMVFSKVESIMTNH